jgi:hypothetical protein
LKFGYIEFIFRIFLKNGAIRLYYSNIGLPNLLFNYII